MSSLTEQTMKPIVDGLRRWLDQMTSILRTEFLRANEIVVAIARRDQVFESKS